MFDLNVSEAAKAYIHPDSWKTLVVPDSSLTVPSTNIIYPKISAAAILAIVLHHVIFRKGEWHMKAPDLLAIYVLSFPTVFLAETRYGAGDLSQSLRNCIMIMASFTVAIFSSLAIYRSCFHRLGSFPGPALAKVSKLWHMSQCLSGQNHLLLDRLHKKYGDFVRTGPNEITVFDPEVLSRLDGPGNNCTKAVWYDFLLPDMGVTTIRDRAFHDQRRRVWTKAFSTKALRTYEDQMAEHAQKLAERIGAASSLGKYVDFSSYAYWFSFDVMGQFALSRSFNMLDKEDWHHAIVTLRRAMAILGPLSPVPWLGQIGFKYLKGYWVVKDWHVMTSWCKARMAERIQIDDNAPNVASWLIADSKERNSIECDRPLLGGDAIVAIVAGSDTVAPTLVFLFYELALHPEQADKLYAELQNIDISDREALRTLPHLNALINETLRYHPAVPSGGYRDTPPEGMTIGGRYIPGNTTIVAPRYTLGRLESCFEQADKFIPERWSSRPEMVKDSRSFLPFAQGRYTCLGKSLALAELRTVTALLVSRYHVRFRHGDDGSRVESEMRDQFTAAPGQLDLVFQPR